MKIKNFPPIIVNGKLNKNYEPLAHTFKTLKNALSIEDIFDDKFRSKEDFDEEKKKPTSCEKTMESQNLITSNLI